jgi:hypothetical protein
MRPRMPARTRRSACLFLSYEVDEEGEEIVWTTAGGLGASEMAALGESLASPAPGADTTVDVARGLERASRIPVIVPRPD